MKKKEFWKLSVLNVLSTPLRSALTIAGFAVGVAAILAVLTLGDAGKNEVVREMGRLGIDKIWVSAKESRGLPRGCGEELAKLTGAAATEHSYLLTEVQNANGDRKTTTAAGMHELSEIKLKEGRLPCAQEWENSGSAALVGEALAAELDLSPGCVVTAFGRTYRICGIARASESVASVPLEEALILPLEEISAISGGMISCFNRPSGKTGQARTFVAECTSRRYDDGDPDGSRNGRNGYICQCSQVGGFRMRAGWRDRRNEHIARKCTGKKAGDRRNEIARYNARPDLHAVFA